MPPDPNHQEWRLRLFEGRLLLQQSVAQSALAFATAVIRALFLLNGGAVVALLAFYGDALAAGGGSPLPAGAVTQALVCFIGGLIAAFLCAGAAYLGQIAFLETRGPRGLCSATLLRLLSILAAAGGLACFAVGAFRAVGALGS